MHIVAYAVAKPLNDLHKLMDSEFLLNDDGQSLREYLQAHSPGALLTQFHHYKVGDA